MMEELAFSFLARKPDERAVAEGNIAENPIFVLTNKEAKPLDASGHADLAKYRRTISISREALGDRVVERSVTLKANPQFGYPTMFACRVLIAIIDEAMRGGLQSDTVHMSRNELLQRVGYKRPCKKEYEDLDNALHAMRTLTIEFKDAWYDKRAGSRAPNKLCDGLIASFAFYDDRQLTLLPPNDGRENATRDGDRRSVISLSKLLFESLKSGYLNGLDLDYMNALASPLAQRLYVYLTKKDGRETYSEGIQEMGPKLGIKKRKPSAVMGALVPALEFLKREIVVQGDARPRRFLSGWNLDEEKRVLTVEFYRQLRLVEDLRRRIAEKRGPSA